MNFQTLPKPDALSKPVAGGRIPPLPRRAAWAIRFLTFAPLIALCIATGLYVNALGKLLRQNLAPVAAAELSRQLNREVRIGQVSALGLAGLTIDNVAISNGRSYTQLNGESLVSAKQIAVRWNWTSLLFDSGNVSHAISGIDFDKPYVLIERTAPSTFNFTDLLQQQTSGKHKPFIAKLTFRNGIVEFRDSLASARLGRAPQVNMASGVNAVVDCGSARYVTFSGNGRGDGVRFRTAEFRGDASRLQAAFFRIAVHAIDADAAYWSDYFKTFQQARVVGGRADLDLTASRLGKTAGKGVDLFGRVVMRDATIDVDKKLIRSPIRNLSGVTTFTGSGLDINGTFTLAGQPLAVQGNLFDFQNPRVALSVSAPHFAAGTAAQSILGLKLPPGLHVTSGRGNIQFTGFGVSPVITSDLVFPEGDFYGNRISNVHMTLVFAKKLLSIPTATFTWNGDGNVIGGGTIDLGQSPPRVALAGRAGGIDMAALRFPEQSGGGHPKFGGIASGQFIVSNDKQPLGVTANVIVGNGHIDQYPITSAQGRIAWVPGQPLILRRMVLRQGDAVATVTGSVPLDSRAPRWDLGVDVAGIDLAHAFPSTGSIKMGGLAAFRGQVTGTLAQPNIAGTAQVFGARLGKFTADAASGGIGVVNGALQLQNVVVHRYPSEARISGTIAQFASPNPKNMSLKLHVAVSQGDLQDFVTLANQMMPGSGPVPEKPKIKTPQQLAAALPALTGTAAGTFDVTGNVDSPIVIGKATVTNATVDAYRIDEARANVDFRDGVLLINKGVVKGEGASATIHGSWLTKTGKVQMIFAGNDLSLDRFQRATRPYADVHGILDFSGMLSGTITAPTTTMGLVARDLTVNGQKFAPFTGFARFGNGTFEKTNDPWEFSLLGRPGNSDPNQAGTRYVIDTLRVQLPTAARPKDQPHITLTGKIPQDYPERLPHLVETIRASKLAALPAIQGLLAQADRLPRPVDGSIAVPEFSVDGSLNALAVKARLQGGNLAAGDNRLSHILASVDAVGGKDPRVAVTMEGTDGNIAGVPIGDIQAAADYANRVVNLSKLHLTSATAYLDASGKAALDGRIDASLDASNVPLALLNNLLPPTRRLTGQVSNISVNVTGLTRSPDLSASIDLAEPTLSIFATPQQAAASLAKGPMAPGAGSPTVYGLDRVRSGQITVASSGTGTAKVLTVTDLAAFKNGRPVASLSGTLPFHWSGANSSSPEMVSDHPLHADLHVDDLGVLATVIPGIDPTRSAGVIDASIDTTPELGLSNLVGTIQVNDAKLALNGFDTAVEKLNGVVILYDGMASIQSFHGHSTKGGDFTLTGAAATNSTASSNLHLAFKALKVDETSQQSWLSKTYRSGVRGQLTGSVGLTGTWKSPAITTSPGAPLVVADVVGTLPVAASEPSGAVYAPPIDPRFDLHVTLGANRKNISIRSGLLRADGAGDLTLKGHLTAPELVANLDIDNGYFIIPPTTRLKFIHAPEGGKPSHITLAYPRTVTDPSGGTESGLSENVDLWAQASVLTSSTTNVSAVSPGAPSSVAVHNTAFGGSQHYTITAHIIGHLNDPNPKEPQKIYTSSPSGLSQEQMEASLIPGDALVGLLGGSAEQAFKSQLSQAFTNIAIPSLLYPLESSVADALGLTAFDLNYSPDSSAVTLVKEFPPRLEATYTRLFGPRAPGAVNSVILPPQYTLKLGYKLTNSLRFSLSTDDQHNHTAAIEGVFGF